MPRGRQLRGQGLRRWLLRAVASLPVCLLLTGCGFSSAPASSISGVELKGRVHGGQQPVSGASVALYAAGATGDGSGAVNLLGQHTVVTDGNGFFGITADYLCPSASTQVYLVASGGNPGLAPGTNNPALVMLAALGSCGTLTSSTSIFVNEVTTVAAAWSLAQFLGPGAVLGSSATNAAGLANAFSVAHNLVDTSTGVAPGAGLPAGARTETEKLYTLANVLAPCVNSDGGTGCAALFSAATDAGSTPANTLDAALNIVRNPAGNVAAVFQAAAAQGPFQPVLSTAPNDWTMSVTYGGCLAGCGGLNLPGSLAIDSGGDVWVANYFGGVVSEFFPAGVPVAASGFSGAGLRSSFGIAIDAQNDVWVTNEQSVTGAANAHAGSVSKFSAAGVELSGFGYTGGGVYYPQAVAADPGGVIWLADYGDSSASLLRDDGSAISGAAGYAPAQLPFTSAVALDTGHNAWFAVQGGAARVTPAGAVSAFPCCNLPAGLAIDATGNVWLADYNASAIVELTSAGAVAHRITVSNGNGGPQGIAIDGAGNVWAANYFGNSLAEVSGASASVLSPVFGFGLDTVLDEPYGLAIDASGNVWLSNAGANTLTQFVGLASPVRTPLAGPAVQP